MGPLFNQSVNLIGLLTDPRGIGQVAQGIRACLTELEVSFIESDLSDMAEGRRIQPVLPTAEGRLNISVINPGETGWVYEKFGSSAYQGCYNIGHWSWELDKSVPQDWKRYVELFDELWAPSTFIANTFAEQFHLPTYTLSPIVRHRANQTYRRSDFGLAEDEFVFLFICDFKSVAERKNPLAAVRAFKSAFSAKDKATLVLKLSSGSFDPAYLQRLQAECMQPNILLIDEIMSRDKIDSLFCLCDAYVSLHRSEGFGITLAEAMLAEKPVIATAWSGNLDFMTDENSYLVKSRLIELDTNYGPYMSGEFWAEPDLEHAAQLMKQVFNNRFEPDPRTASAKALIESKYSLSALSISIEERLCAVAPFVRTLERVALELKTAQMQTLERTTSNAVEEEFAVYANASKEIESPECTVTVCLPVYNGAAFLDDAIRSILQQSFQDFELLIADDQSSDDSLQIIEKFAKDDPRIRYRSNTQRVGLFKNYNSCIRRAKGEYIKLFAQDDLLEPDALAEQVKVLRTNPSVALVCCDKTFINELGKPFLPDDADQLARLEEKVPKDLVVSGVDVIAASFFPVVNLIGEPSTVMFRRTAVGEGFDETFYHVGDLDYWFHILLRGEYYRIGKKLCQFRRHSGSATSRNVKSLLYAIDTMKLGKKFVNVLSAQGYTYEEFLADAIYCLAAQSLALTDRDLSDAEEILSSALPAVKPGDFQELAFRALQYAGRCNKVSQQKQTESSYAKKSDPISVLEDEVRRLLDSPYWHVTKPLRDTNRIVFRGVAKDSEDSLLHSSIHEEDYMNHLEALKTAILTSRSWKLTKPFRSLFPKEQ